MPGMRCFSTISGATADGLTGLDCSPTDPKYSMGMWLYRQGITGAYNKVCSHSSSVENIGGVQVNCDGGLGKQITFWSCDAASSSTCGDSNIFYNIETISYKWFHLGISWDGARVKFYYNGNYSSSGALTLLPSAGGTRRTNVGGGYSRGSIAKMFDVQFFPNIALNPADMKALVDPRKTVSGCKGRWFRNWKDVSGGMLIDESGNGNNLVIGSGTEQCEEPLWREAIGVR